MNSDLKSFTFKNLIFILIIIQILVYFVIFGPISFFNIDVNVNKEIQDFPSYIFFDFSSLKLVFSQHRTFGLPLILKFYSKFDLNLIFWPNFVFIFYSLSNIFLFYSLHYFNFSKIFSFLFLIGLTFSITLYIFISFPTELISISFAMIALGLMFLSIKKNKIYIYALFSFFLFFTYQIRPSFIIFTLLPVIFCMLNFYVFKNKSNIKKIAFFSLTPIVILILVRFIFVGSLGLISFNGGMSANSTVFLTDDLIPKLKSENQDLAKALLERKKKLNYPCNLDFGEEQTSYYKYNLYGQYPCWSQYFNSNWLEMIKIYANIEPFPEGDERNINAWDHVPTLANFWQERKAIEKNVEIDKHLVKLSKDVYKLKYKKILKKLVSSPIYFFKIQRDYNGNLIIFFILLIIPVIFFRKKFEKKNRNNNYELNLTLTFLIITLGNLFILYFHQNGDPRSVIIQTFYIIPIFFSYLIFLIHKNLVNKVEI